jgi:Disulphide bond corrector protein DsbC
MFVKAFVFAVLGGTAVMAAQTPSGLTRSKDVDLSQLTTETKHLKISASASAASAAPGARVSLFVDVAPKPKMHVYAPDQKDYIPVALTLAADAAAFKAAPPQFPKAETYFFAPLKETQRVYSKAFRIVQPVTLAPTASGEVVIKGTVRYQACDDAICYVPQNVPISWSIKVK